MNKIKLTLPLTSDKEFTIPIEMTWDYQDRMSALSEFEENTIKQVLNEDKDFEVVRFEPNGRLDVTTGAVKTDMNYSFNFGLKGNSIDTTTWSSSYIPQGFTSNDVFYYSKTFTQSFFKLDLYNTTDLKTQVNYVTIILPAQQGITADSIVGYETKKIKIPTFKLDFLGNMEGLFIYWLKNRDFLNIDTFYMTAKFFNGKTGNFVKMMNKPQSTITGDKYNFDQEKYFYYKVKLDYNDFSYKMYDISNSNMLQVGDETNPIKWYNYFNA